MIDDPLWPPDRRIMAGAKKRTRQNVKDENQNRVMLHVVAVCSSPNIVIYVFVGATVPVFSC